MFVIYLTFGARFTYRLSSPVPIGGTGERMPPEVKRGGYPGRDK